MRETTYSLYSISHPLVVPSCLSLCLGCVLCVSFLRIVHQFHPAKIPKFCKVFDDGGSRFNPNIGKDSEPLTPFFSTY